MNTEKWYRILTDVQDMRVTGDEICKSNQAHLFQYDAI